MYKTLTIIGTRPEAIKIAILHKLLLENEKFDPCLVTTGQHNTLLVQALDDFGISDYHRLTDEIPNISLAGKCSMIINELDKYISSSKPDLIIVQGDTLSSFCASLVAYLNRIPTAHIEAGLRTGNKWRPYPEEIFRQFNDLTGDILFTPTESARQNLISEGHNPNSIYITGNTAIDALKMASQLTKDPRFTPGKKLQSIIDSITGQNRIPCILTIHRREARGQYFKEILQKLTDFANACQLSYIVPVHPAPWIHNQLAEFQSDHFINCQPLSYLQFVWLMKHSKLMFSDSGGIQEEGPHLALPVIVLRQETERPEAIASGNNHFIKETTPQLINKLLAHNPTQKSIYGDGDASRKILCHLESFLDRNKNQA